MPHYRNRPVPTLAIIRDLQDSGCQTTGDRISFKIEDFDDIIKAFLQATELSDSEYLAFNPGLARVENLQRHWRDHGYFEGRKSSGLSVDFDIKTELLVAPDRYFELIQQSEVSILQRKYRAAEFSLRQAIDLLTNGTTAKYLLASLVFKLRRPWDSEGPLIEFLKTRNNWKPAKSLLIDVFTDLGLTDAACELATRFGIQTDKARYMLRLIERGDLSRALAIQDFVRDDWPLKERLVLRLQSERQAARHSLIAAIKSRRSDVDVTRTLAAIVNSLAKLGYHRLSKRISDSFLSSVLGGILADDEAISMVIEALRITVGNEQALIHLNRIRGQVGDTRKLQILSVKLRLETAFALETLKAEQFAGADGDELRLEVCLLLRSGRGDEALKVLRQRWEHTPEAGWNSTAVMMAARMCGLYEGLSAEHIPTGTINLEPIPRSIVQFWDQTPPPGEVCELMNTWSGSHPDFEYKLYSLEAARLFIQQHFGEDHAELFDSCYHPAMQADFFRAAFLFAQGGVYVDADERCNENIANLMNENTHVDFIATLSETEFFINNRFLLCSKGHPFIERVLERIIVSLRAARDSQTRLPIWETTGPFQYTRAFCDLLIESDSEAVSAETIHRVGLIYAHDLSRFVSMTNPTYKTTKAGNWRAL